MKLSTYKLLPPGDQWKLIDIDDYVPVKPSVETCQPQLIDMLYCSVPFPMYKGKSVGIDLDIENIYNGNLTTSVINMVWKGYKSQVYDGELKLSPLSEETSRITGKCNGFDFQFSGTSLDFGVWPGFLLLYRKKK